MKLSGKIEQILWFMMAAFVVVVAGFLMKFGVPRTFADIEGAYIENEAKFVTIYDNGKKLIVKTDARTVGDVLARAGISVEAGDKVEPAFESDINVDDYYINIYRARPVIFKDGVKEVYLMTASYDLKTIAQEAGVTVYDGDEIMPLANMDFLEAGVANVYGITRNGGRVVTVEEEVPFAERLLRSSCFRRLN